MKNLSKLPSSDYGFSLGLSLAGDTAHYVARQSIYSQGSNAGTVFFVREGLVRLTTRFKNRASAVTAVMGAGELLGMQCLIDFPLRVSSAVALTDTSVSVIDRREVFRALSDGNKLSQSLVSYLLSNNKKNTEYIADLLTCSADQRLARILLQLAHLDKKSAPIPVLPFFSHQVLAEMIGTTRSRVNFFMNQFRRLGYIRYDGGGLEVRKSLRKVLAVN